MLGRAELVERLRRHPLQRALRIDKLSLAALEGTLLLHLEAPERIPVLRTLAQGSNTVRERAERLAAATGGEVEETVGRVGGGALPLAELPSFACALEESLAAPLRAGEPPVVGVVRDGRLLLDCLTLTDAEAEEAASLVGRRTRMTELWDFLRGALMTKALAAVVDAGVPEALADGPRPVSELQGDPDTLHRLLRALASDGVFRETKPGVFEHTEQSRLLLGPGWSEFAHLFGGVFFEATTDLDASTSEAPFPSRFGTGFWEWLAEHPAERATFDAAMAGERLRPAERLADLEWREGEVVVDVGGGNGALLAALIQRRPELRGIVLDLPETVRDEAALGDRIQFVAGSFFESVPEGDAYLLSGILHDWPDEDAAPDSAHHPGGGIPGRAAADQRVRDQARQRRRRSEVARPADARPGRRPRARRGAVARAAREHRLGSGAASPRAARSRRVRSSALPMNIAVNSNSTRTATLSTAAVRRQSSVVAAARNDEPEQGEDPHRRAALRVALEARFVVGIARVEPRGHEQRRRRRDQSGRAAVAIDDDRAHEHRNEGDEADDPFPIR